jgi:4,5-DOPA dioxygenase extradiol
MRAPVLFASHGSPDLALAHGHPWAASLEAFGRGLRVRGILAVSAHWSAAAPAITSAARPGVLHDFSGFSPELGHLDYPSPGDPPMAESLSRYLASRGLPTSLEGGRPLDHGVWSVTRRLRPGADLPVLQLALPRWEPRRLLELGRALEPLREEGLLILASGGLVHHLGKLSWDEAGDRVEPWAAQAEAWVLDRIREGDLADHRLRWPWSRDAAPTTEHLDPLFVALGAAGKDGSREVFRGFQLGALSLACLAWGLP